MGEKEVIYGCSEGGYGCSEGKYGRSEGKYGCLEGRYGRYEGDYEIKNLRFSYFFVQGDGNFVMVVLF